MQTKPQDKVELARSKYLAAIAVREREIQDLRFKLKVLDEIDGESSNGAPDVPGLYSTSKLTNAVLDAVNSLGLNGGIPATEIRKYIAAYGYRHPNPKNFPIATVIALNRLSKNGKIGTVKTNDGKRLFMAKK